MIETITRDQEWKLISALDIQVLEKDSHGFSVVRLHPTVAQVKRVRNVAAFILMLDGGFRVSEVTGFVLSDCYFDGKSVNSISVRATEAKNHRQRTVPCTVRLKAALDRLFRFTAGHLVDDHPVHVIFSNSNGKRITSRSLQRIFVTVGLQTLNINLYPHLLRHTFATNLLKLTNIRTVQELLGHKHLASTQIYTHVNNNDLEAAIDKLNDANT